MGAKRRVIDAEKLAIEYRRRKKAYDPHSTSCYFCESDNTEWDRIQIDTAVGRATGGLLAKYVSGLDCKDCGVLDTNKKRS